MTNEVTELIAALRNGMVSLDDVAQRFRERSWRVTSRPKSKNYLEFAAAVQDDPDPLIPGSFDEVAAAYHRGDISHADYRVLADAAAESIRRDHLHDS